MKKVLFIHVPKTAGRTLLSLLTPHYAPERTLYGDWANITPKIAPSYDLVAGHLYANMFNLADLLGHYKITILRDPMDQAISHYYHLNERRASHGHLPDYLEQALKVGLSESILDGSFVPTLDTASSHLSSLTKWGATPEENIGSAKTNLRYFDAVGFADNYEPFVRALCARLNIDCPVVPHLNPPKWKPAQIPLTAEAAKRLAEILEQEYWLYSYAKKEFGGFNVWR